MPIKTEMVTYVSETATLKYYRTPMWRQVNLTSLNLWHWRFYLNRSVVACFRQT